MNFVEIGKGDRPGIVFAHGWARTHRDFIPSAEALIGQQKSMLLDLPGFGDTPRPKENWTTKDYADHVAGFLQERVGRPVVWVGHSFGARVGLRLAVHHPGLLKGLVLVSAAGVPMRRPLWRRLAGRLQTMRFRALRRMAKDQATVEALEARFGSPDYVQSRQLGLRDIFLNAIREDQTPDLGRITARTVLLYGARDTETPPEMGQRIAGLIPGARLLVLPEFDHINILFRGHHIIALKAKELVEA
ncbi:MAG: alpha/beta fold hydrolase [Devosia sp.]|nr:alpha/beta fold hydrolase [Devosia sp.]